MGFPGWQNLPRHLAAWLCSFSAGNCDRFFQVKKALYAGLTSVFIVIWAGMIRFVGYGFVKPSGRDIVDPSDPIRSFGKAKQIGLLSLLYILVFSLFYSGTQIILLRDEPCRCFCPSFWSSSDTRIHHIDFRFTTSGSNPDDRWRIFVYPWMWNFGTSYS